MVWRKVMHTIEWYQRVSVLLSVETTWEKMLYRNCFCVHFLFLIHLVRADRVFFVRFFCTFFVLFLKFQARRQFPGFVEKGKRKVEVQHVISVQQSKAQFVYIRVTDRPQWLAQHSVARTYESNATKPMT